MKWNEISSESGIASTTESKLKKALIQTNAMIIMECFHY